MKRDLSMKHTSGRRNSVRHHNKGLTLIELVVVQALLAVIIMTTLTALSFGDKTFGALENNSELQQEAQSIAALISAQVRQSSSFVVNNSPAGLILEFPDETTARFDEDEAKLIFTDRSNTVSELTVNLHDISFTQASNGIEVRIELRRGELGYQFKTTVYHRMQEDN